MDALCLTCGHPLPQRRKLKQFCSYSCRGQHAVKALDGPKYQSAFVGSKNTRKNKALQSLKRQSIAGIAFSKLNPATIRIDLPSKHGVGWLMEVAWPGETRQRWVARVKDRASEPLPLEEAKRAAAAMLHEHRRVGEGRDWIAELNQLAANEVDRAAIQRERRSAPVDLMGAQGTAQRGPVDPELRRAILDAELDTDMPKLGAVDTDVKPSPLDGKLVLLGDDYEITYDENGYPEIPQCLNRRSTQ